MTDYTEVPTVNALHAESQQILSAIENLDAGGTLSSMSIVPPLQYTPAPPPVPGSPPVAVNMLMAVSVMVPPPVDAALLTQIRAWLDQRLVTISEELTALGISVPPVSAMSASSGFRMPGLPQYPPMSVMPSPPPPPSIPPTAMPKE